MTVPKREFWKTKTLNQMTEQEWESICDGCAKCCLIKLQDKDTEEIQYTSIACKLLNTRTCRCKDYSNRKLLVPECLILRPLSESLAKILPDTCAYRLLYYGKDLPDWHPLISGDKNSTITSGASIAGNVISEKHVHAEDLDNFIININA